MVFTHLSRRFGVPNEYPMANSTPTVDGLSGFTKGKTKFWALSWQARLVAKGLSQKEGINYQVLSPVVKHKQLGFSRPWLGFVVSTKVCLLKMSLRFDSCKISHGYSRNQFDDCVYLKGLSNGTFIYLLLYMHDMLLATKNKADIDDLKALLKNKFEM
ncbi:hypothetical protein OSB04_025109 [Centaurea solstitialis]|uniref:Reverse transcriptase Ty1/copia-type domain-containing protein n=1 Tax=Centaurea solstitialis TaxID=347529 RepID=A0AA38W3Q9_9ASTR|nr:hypothetical protein OSB04_025109 [Centaurea solstitialis]